MKNIFFAALLAFVMIAAGCTQPPVPQQNQTGTPNVTGATSVMISSFSFQPASITVAKGATVTWTNQDPVAHTVTGADFDSGAIAPGQNYSHVFDNAGAYQYHCAIHTSMTGTVIVQ